MRPATLVRICDECNYGSYEGRCVICGGVGVSDAYYCKECTLQEKDVSSRAWGLGWEIGEWRRVAGGERAWHSMTQQVQLSGGVDGTHLFPHAGADHCSVASLPCCLCCLSCLQRDGCPKIINLGSAKTDLFYERKKYVGWDVLFVRQRAWTALTCGRIENSLRLQGASRLHAQV